MGDNSDIDDVLTDLLSNNCEEAAEEQIPERTLKELDFNFLEKDKNESDNKKIDTIDNHVSEVYDANADSSDDEDRRYFQEQKYSDSGRDIKQLLKSQSTEKKEQRSSSLNLNRLSKNKPESLSTSFKYNTNNELNNTNNKISKTVAPAVSSVYCDPIFGLGIINPLISSTELKQRMSGKTPVGVSKVKYHISTDNVSNDWVIAGVLIKTDTRQSQKGSTYCIWKISDLSETVRTVSIFLFSGAYKTFWKTVTGTVIGILNPNVLESKDNFDEATLSCDNPQKIMILGKSKDMGTCKSRKKNGEPCTAIVNINRCEFCVYHVKQEYKKCSKRAELQSSSSTQKFSLDSKKNKAYTAKPTIPGMQPFIPVYAKRNEKLYAKDCERLALLSGASSMSTKLKTTESNEEVKKGFAVELTTNQAKKDHERLNKLKGKGHDLQITTEVSKVTETPVKSELLKTTSEVPNVLHRSAVNLSLLGSPAASKASARRNVSASPATPTLTAPRLGAGCVNGKIDFSLPITKKHVDMAKVNAIKWIQQNGQIKRTDPNKIRLKKEEQIERGTKRQREAEEQEEQVAKKLNLSNKFKELLEAKSAHTDLIEKSYEKEKDKYFDKLEMKEKMEEKMLSTFKIDCKAVKCILCKYTAFSASDMCKEQKHPLRVINAVKRFFKCADCGNRTVSLDRIPSFSCKKCNGSNWTKAAMMAEKKTKLVGANLSIRGDEEKFVGSVINDANLNLLVPETD